MNDVVISARGLGKRYLIGHETADRNQTFRERIMAGAGGLARNMRRTARGQQLVQGEVEEFWALKDVDFDIRRGDTVGIIGRNGAGKSTLLKILSRITEPTTGRVDIRGRVASLLEVGTGFHPELTGRENIFLNGAILGMSRAEIRRKLDEIIDFAGVEKFLDTPVKRYSSGMRVRLAFSVAAHLEPEVLIVDEVLAVGDAEFQRKCLGKMEDVAGSGRTVLFVSHNFSAISKLCKRGLQLSRGCLERDTSADEVIFTYQSQMADDVGSFNGEVRARDSLEPYIRGITVQGEGAAAVIRPGESIELRIDVANAQVGLDCRIGVYDLQGQKVLDFHSGDVNRTTNVRGGFRLFIPQVFLLPGSYTVNVALYQTSVIVERLAPAARIDVTEGIFEGRRISGGVGRGQVFLPAEWARLAS